MRRNDPLNLGIELNEREVRLVQAGVKGGRPYVVRAIAEPLPVGAMMGGVVLEPGTVVLALRRAIDALGGAAPVGAAVGVSGDQSNFRAISVPPCPEAELPALVTSEVEHQGALNPGDLFDFFPIQPPGVATDAMQSLAIVGIDATISQTLVEVIEGAGLTVAAIEPVPLAMLRTIAVGLPQGASAFMLVVGAAQTEAAYFVDGRLAAFRRLDVGMDSLVQSYAPMPSTDDADGLYPGAAETFSIPAEGWSHIDQDAADRLALEAQRTMDYVQRADRANATIDRVRVVSDDPQIDALAKMLERRFGMTVEVVRPPAPQDGESEGRFAAAFGLAVRANPPGLPTPSVDLFMAQRTEAQRVETKRYFLGSVLVAALSVAVGLAGCLMYNGQIAASKARCAAVTAQVAETKKASDAALDAQATEALRDKALRKEGVALGTLMDGVVGGLDPGVGLKLVSVTDDLSVRIAGEAHDETALARTAQALKASPLLLNVAVDRFDRSEKANAGRMTFEISGKTVTGDRIVEKKPS